MVQVMKNRRYHRGIKRSPFEAMFGKKMIFANEDGNIPTEEERGLTVEEKEDEQVCLSARVSSLFRG